MSASVIEVKELWHWYLRGTPLETAALLGANFEVAHGEIAGVMGHTGSGKSTLIQHLNGLLRPHRGSVHVLDADLGDPKTDPRPLRRRIGMLFQFPETQLFDPTVGDEIAFGPRRMNLSREEVRRRVRLAMERSGIPFESYKDRYTFGLSGGEQRMVALAGVLALEPEILVLDEPTSGLDPRGRRRILQTLRTLHDEAGTTLVFVSHNMEDVAELVQRVWVLAGGKTVLHGETRAVFGQVEGLRELGLGIPQVTEVAHELRARGVDVRPDIITVDEAAEALWTSSSSRAM
jgi:energy-coupling factor transport system ATP-binding protein